MTTLDSHNLTGMSMDRAAAAAAYAADLYEKVAVVGPTCMLVGFGVLIRVRSDLTPVSIGVPLDGFPEVPVVLGRIMPFELTDEQCARFGFVREGDHTLRPRDPSLGPISPKDQAAVCTCMCAIHGGTETHKHLCCALCAVCGWNIRVSWADAHRCAHEAER